MSLSWKKVDDFLWWKKKLNTISWLWKSILLRFKSVFFFFFSCDWAHWVVNFPPFHSLILKVRSKMCKSQRKCIDFMYPPLHVWLYFTLFLYLIHCVRCFDWDSKGFSLSLALFVGRTWVLRTVGEPRFALYVILLLGFMFALTVCSLWLASFTAIDRLCMWKSYASAVYKTREQQQQQRRQQKKKAIKLTIQ